MMISLISEHEPRKGTETTSSIKEYCDVTISEHEPRKGTETCMRTGGFPAVLRAFQNTNPERGRKHDVMAYITKPDNNFRTRTPKGDGNGGRTC